MKLSSVYHYLHSDLQTIEKELEKTISAEHPLLQEASLHILQAGGKRIRPLFVLLAAKYGKYDIHHVKNVAAALELIHMASLVHDDVIDDASIRRGKSTIKAKWDNKVAIYTGDYIFAKSLELMSIYDDPNVHMTLSNTMVELVLGEVQQIKEKFDYEQNCRAYLRRIKRKTALLIAASCELGAMTAKAPAHTCKCLYWFGYNVGMAFQITDDILDFVGNEKTLGKPAGSDLRQGHITLPVLYALEDLNIKNEIIGLSEDSSKDEFDHVINYIKKSSAIKQSVKVSDLYLQKAIRILDTLPKSKANASLRQVVSFIGKRKF
ncbi:heptaprenyl diphosphate synthase component II [Bacillus sp. HMF5848]|uniref:heptaprenyl diphosphate synthase component II n=1 Tax=Bacillus sp. HMF5848 TaxID=2495421 RepID=UPI000F779D03|nr:heptaprenyl diphosphate synthase component II [Bacillus sp. HMF5848]RSK27434.1 heptaprenyl diphosphate synthase component II [Bacillus sp. HMF5848]